jgi:hypothetical protein
MRSPVASPFRKPQRITFTINHSTHERLSELSYEQGRSLSNLVAYLVELRLEQEEERKGDANSSQSRDVLK